MSALGRWILGNWPLKLAALGLATVLWAGVALSDSTQTWSGPVPIEVLSAPAGGALLESPGVVERISYRAPSDLLITNDTFRASIDLSSVQPRSDAAPQEVAVDVFPIDPRVRVVDYSPSGVQVRLDTVVSRVTPVTIDHGPVPEGIELGPIIAEPNRVLVTGASSRLKNVRSVEGRFVVDASGINIDEDVTIEPFDELGALVPGIEIEPATVRVRADVARQLAYSTVPVIPELVGEPARGKRVDDVSVVPATVTVSGESPDIRTLEFVTTEAVDISDQSVELVAEDVPLVLPEEVTSRGDSTVTVLVTFTDALGSRSFEVGTALVGARPGLSYRVAEPSVTVVISGSVDLLDEVADDELIVEVPVADLEVGDNDVMPTVRVPRGLRALRLIPETVRVTVDRPS